jgi:ubiquinone/menaquinone biosynthesis C-methylase UbiE
MKRLNLGCGRDIRSGWINVDAAALPGVDIVADLDLCRTKPLPFSENEIEEFTLSHVLEHIRDALALMAELHRIAKPDAKAEIRVPFGASDDAWADPTHVRPYFVESFAYFSQPVYWRADYGYRGDWNTEKVIIAVDKTLVGDRKPPEIYQMLRTYRNIGLEMVAILRAVKPIRDPKKELITIPNIEFSLV